MLIPKSQKDLGVIIEFKKVGLFNKMALHAAAEIALQQIEDKKYAQELLDREVERILYLAIVFEGKNVLLLPRFRD